MKRLLIIIITICLLPSSVLAEKINVDLAKCVDGDTFKFIKNNKTVTGRFLAIDTPEVNHPKKKEESFGKEASKYTCNRLTMANKIQIEYDSNSDKLDKYKRHLVWVFVDDNLLQEELLEKGYAKIDYIYGNYKYLSYLKIVEKKAFNEKKGIWNEEAVRKKRQNIENNKLINEVIKIIKKVLF